LRFQAKRIDEHTREAFERGRRAFQERIGQMNLSRATPRPPVGQAALCRDHQPGSRQRLPAYRLEWQAFGSLQWRLRACYSGVRAEMPAYGSERLLDLKLFLAWRGDDLPVEAPGVRR
jgi:sulfur-oxidizing protein SoxA